MATPTLLEDLISFAEACESGDWGDLDEDAKRLREHARRLAEEMERTRQQFNLSSVQAGIELAVLTRINGGGPAKEKP